MQIKNLMAVLACGAAGMAVLAGVAGCPGQQPVTCGGAVCGAGQVCVDDMCVAGTECGSDVCTTGETCVNDACVADSDLCGNDVCTTGQTCVNDVCVDNSSLCGNDVCDANEVCVNDMCVVGVACGNDVCTNGEACNNGVCEPESTGGDAAAGQAVFSANCQACHAADGSGGIGPDIRDFTAQEVQDGFNSAAIHSSLTVTLTAQDFADISAFLDTSASS